MLRRTVLIVMLLLGTVQPSVAQLPVIDAAAIAKLVEEIGVMGRQLKVLIDQYNDMLKQGRPGSPDFQTHTARLLALMAELGQKSSILYGHDGSQTVWSETYTEAETWEDGTWLEHERARSHATMTTQQDLLRLIEERQKTFAADEDHIQVLQEAVRSATGRNEILHAQAALQAEQVRQTHALQALVMVLANSQIVAAAAETNEKIAREAQDQMFLKNWDRPIPKPVFKDHGFLNFQSLGN